MFRTSLSLGRLPLTLSPLLYVGILHAAPTPTAEHKEEANRAPSVTEQAQGEPASSKSTVENSAAGETEEQVPSAPRGAVVASLGTRSWTLEELDAKIATELHAAQLEFERRRYSLRQAALNELLNQSVLEQRLSETSPEEQLKGINGLLEREAFQDLNPPTEAERLEAELQARGLKNESHRDQIPGEFEAFQEQIGAFMLDQRRQAVLQSYLTALRSRYQTREFLEPPRASLSGVGFSKGPEDAPITIVEFADFECGFCARAGDVLSQVTARFPGKIRVIYRDFPLGFHQNAKPAAVAARCAGAQGKFWEMHDALFAQQGALGESLYLSEARRLSLDIEPYERCLQNPERAAEVDRDFSEGQAVGVSGTPAFFINGVELSGAQPPEAFVALIQRELERLKSAAE